MRRRPYVHFKRYYDCEVEKCSLQVAYQVAIFLCKQAVRLGGRHNMPPPRDLDF